MWALSLELWIVLITPIFQIAVPAGHEFIVSTDPKYQEICDDKVLWMDYVRFDYTLALEVDAEAVSLP